MNAQKKENNLRMPGERFDHCTTAAALVLLSKIAVQIE